MVTLCGGRHGRGTTIVEAGIRSLKSCDATNRTPLKLLDNEIDASLFCFSSSPGSACGQDRTARFKGKEDIDLLKRNCQSGIMTFTGITPSRTFIRRWTGQPAHRLPSLEDWAVLLRLQGHLPRRRFPSVFERRLAAMLFSHCLCIGLRKDFCLGASNRGHLRILFWASSYWLSTASLPIEEAKYRAVGVAENASIVRHRLPNLLPSWYLLSYVGVVDGAWLFLQDTNGYTFTFNLPLSPYWLPLNRSICSLQTCFYAFYEEPDNRSVFWREYLEEEQNLYIRYNRCTSRG